MLNLKNCRIEKSRLKCWWKYLKTMTSEITDGDFIKTRAVEKEKEIIADDFVI